MIALNIAMLVTIYTILHVRLMDNAKKHIHHNIDAEFRPHYEKNDLDTLNKIIEDEHIQVLDSLGKVIIDVKTSLQFYPQINPSHVRAAIEGKTVYETLTNEDERYMITYAPLDKEHVVKVTMSLEELYDFEEDFRIILLFIVPAMFILSYFLSRYMVHQSLRPIIDVMTYQDTFSSNVTHELNSPLTSIKGSIEVALRKERAKEEYRDALKLTLRKVNDIISLLKNLSLLAKSKFRSLDLLKERVDMQEIIQSLVEKYEPPIYAKNLKLEMVVDPDTHCMCDTSLLTRVMENLLENAVKYAPENGEINIITRQMKKYFTLTISNTCECINKDDLKNLFKPFYRAKGSAEGVEGAGLGLHIVKYIIQSHGGKIDVELDGDNLFFTLRVPVE